MMTSSEQDIFLTAAPLTMVDKGAPTFGPEKFLFFRNDHFYSHKVTGFQGLRADSWVKFLS